MSARRPPLTYANVVSTLALVLVVTGGGAALAAVGKNAVGSKEIKNGAIKSVDVKNDALTGRDIKESTLGKVPAAAAVDTVRRVSVAMTNLQEPKVIATKGPLTLTLVCFYDQFGSLTTSSSIRIRTSQDNAAVDSSEMPSGDRDLDVADGNPIVGFAGSNVANLVEVSAVTPGGQPLQVHGLVSTADPAGTCRADLVVVG